VARVKSCGCTAYMDLPMVAIPNGGVHRITHIILTPNTGSFIYGDYHFIAFNPPNKSFIITICWKLDLHCMYLLEFL